MTVHVLMITDMSGSMGSLAEDVRGGFNSFLDEQAAKGSDQKYTVVLFDHAYMPLCSDVEIKDVPRLTKDNYMPRGMTALLDAVGRTVAGFDISKLGDDDKLILVIQTDGFENASKEYSTVGIKALLDKCRQTGKFREIYIGAGVDSWSQAQAMGMQSNSYLNTSGSKGATRSTYGNMGQSVAVAAASGPDDDYLKDLRDATKDK